MANKILESFMRGVQERTQKEDSAEKMKVQKEQFKAEQDRLKQAAEHAQKIADAQLQMNEAVTKFTLASKMQEDFAKSGTVPPGHQETSSQSLPIADGIAGTSHTYSNPSGGVLPSFTGVDPMTSAQQEAARLEVTQEPLIRKARELETQKQAGDEALKRIEMTAKMELEKEQHERRLAEIRLQNSGRNEAARIRGAATRANKVDPLDVPIDPKAQRDEFGVQTYDPTLTLRKAGGLDLIKPLTPQQIEKNAGMSHLEDLTSELKGMLEEKTPDGKNMYQQYYKGAIGGLIREVTSKQEGLSPKIEAIRQKTAEIETLTKNIIAKAGASLTSNEQAMLEKQAPSPSFMTTPERAKAILEGFEASLKASKQELIKGQKTGRSLKDVIVVIEYDENGKRKK